MDKKSIKNVIIVVSIILIFTVAYLLLKKLTEDNFKDYEEFLKDYEINEYIPTYISDEAMAKIYLNDYIHYMYYDVSKAYDLLDDNYKALKFGSLDNYKNYVNSLKYATYELSRYYIKNSNGYKIFGVYDKNNNFFAFKTNGVMQYSVFLDDYTVEIW